LVRQCLYDVFHQDYLTALTRSSDQRLAAIAVKALKEVNYHVQFSSEWLIRLGDGTQESHDKVQNSLQGLMTYSAEFFQASKADVWALKQGVGPDVAALKPGWDSRMDALISQATLSRPAADAAIWQGKEGSHGEFLALLLSEMQSLPRSYPDATW
jgi:ring-1,2-phenylacetyl-CoA epoxidase subunit PaaC